MLIALYDTRNPGVGYNVLEGGAGFTGPFTKEHRDKLSTAAKKSRFWLKAAEQAKGVPRPADVCARIAKANTGKTRSLETRNKIRLNRLSQPDPRLGKTHSQKTKDQISAAKKGSPSQMKGKHHTKTANDKNRKAHLIDIQGKSFGNLVPMSIAGRSSSGEANWLIRCVVCGAEAEVRSSRIRSGESHFMKSHDHWLPPTKPINNTSSPFCDATTARLPLLLRTDGT